MAERGKKRDVIFAKRSRGVIENKGSAFKKHEKRTGAGPVMKITEIAIENTWVISEQIVSGHAVRRTAWRLL